MNLHRTPRTLTLLLVALTALTLAACGNTSGDGGGDDDDTLPDLTADTEPADTAEDTELAEDTAPDEDLAPPPLIEDLVVVANPSNALSYFVEWRTSESATSTLSVDCGPDYQESFELAARTEHRVFVMGLVDGAECALEVTATSEADATHVESLDETLTVGPLPEWLPVPEVLVHEPERVQPGWTMINLTNAFDNHPFAVAVIDAEGRYRWYHQMAVDHPGTDTNVIQASDGIVVCGARRQVPMARINWQGTTLWSLDIDVHHDCRFTDETETRIRHLTRDPEWCPYPDWGDHGIIREREVPSGEVTWEYNVCDFWLPEVIDLEDDWGHFNTIEPFPDGSATLMSARNQHALFKTDEASGEVLWRLGLDGDFEMAPEDLFYRQHAPEIQPDGHIVLFDNGRFDRPFSRLIELAYDETTMTAEVVWEYVPEPAIYAPIWGDADRLPNGNTLGTFGLRSRTEATHFIEVDADSQEVWHVQLPLKWGTYRADRVELPRGFVVE